MTFAWDTAKKDWQRLLRDPVSLLLWIGLPLIVGLLMTLAFGGREGPEPKAHVLVADLDDTFLSNFLVGALSQDAAGSFLTAESVTEEEGRRRIEKGEVSALLVIPTGFSEAVLREDPAALELVKNPAQRILPDIVEEALSLLTDATFYLHRLIGEDLRAFAEGPPEGATTFPDERIAAFSTRINQTMERLGDLLFPPVIELEVTTGEESEGETEATASTAQLFVPGLLFMALVFMAQGLAQDFWRERNRRTLRRVVVSPRSISEFLAGKLIAGAGLMLGVVVVALGVAWAYFGLPAARFPLAVLWATFSGVVLITILLVIMLHASSERTAGVLAMALVFPLLMVGGNFFPFEIMPEGMAAVGKLTPNGWALAQLQAILEGEMVASSFLVALAGLFAVGGVLFLWSVRRLHDFARG
ncbi:MAG: ABC transporter permease [Candidatus Eiseniibacteriota bacterium]